MLVRHKAALEGTAREVETDLWRTVRFLLREDGYGVTLTDVTIKPGPPAVYGYDHHTEVCYCLEGRATFEELETGRRHEIRPGSLWAVHPGERFRFTAHLPTRLVSVCRPPLAGPEVNDEAESFPPS